DAQQPVARGLRAVGHDADLGPDQGVDQGGLADVGTADDGDVAGAVGGWAHAGIVGAIRRKPFVGAASAASFSPLASRRNQELAAEAAPTGGLAPGQALSSCASTASAAACSAARREPPSPSAHMAGSARLQATRK